MAGKLPVFATVGEALGCVRQHGRRIAPYVVALVIIAAAIIIGAVLMGIASVFFGGKPAFGPQNFPVGLFAVFFLAELAFFAAILPVMNSYQRLVLQGENARVGFGYGREEWLYIGTFFRLLPQWILPALLAGFTVIVAGGLGDALHIPWLSVPVMIVIWGAMLAYFSKLALAFPAAAQGVRLSGREALRMGKGNGWRLIFANFLPSFLFFVPEGVISFLTSSKVTFVAGQMAETPALLPLPLWGHVLVALLNTALYLAGLFTAVGASALAYRFLSSPPSEDVSAIEDSPAAAPAD